ncbi:MAG: pantetheine-phosphate adenylyltransferase [Bacillota bacterium]
MKVLLPGSFDPLTFGHLDIIQRAATLFDEVLVTVFHNPEKAGLLTPGERVELLKEATADLLNVAVDAYPGLVATYARERGARVIIKGLRALSDFEYEFKMALMNKRLDNDLETLFMMTANEYSFLSSSLIKDVVRWGGSVEGLVPPRVEEVLREKLLKR